MKLTHSLASNKIRGSNSEEAFNVSVIDTVVPVTTTGQTLDTVKDEIIENIPDTFENNDFDLFTNTVGETLENLTPGICSISGNQITRVANGVARIKVSKEGESKIISKVVRQTLTSTAHSETSSFVVGSLMKHIRDQFNTRLSGLTKSQLTTLMTDESSWSGSASTLTRNASLWCADLDLSGVAVATNDKRKGCVVLSPRHIASATHSKPATVTLIDINGNTVEATVASWVAISNKAGSPYPGDDGDLSIGYLTADLPATITPVSVLPSDYLSYLPSIEKKGFPVMYSNDGRVGTNTYFGEGRALHVSDMRETDVTALGSSHELSMQQSEWPERVTWWQPNWSSGSPILTIISDQPVFLASFHTNMPSGVFVSNLFDEINAAMTSLHGDATHQLQTIDLSGFPTYP